MRVDEPPEEEQLTGSVTQAETSPHSQPQISVQQQQRYIVETITMTTVTERRIVREADDHQIHKQPSSDGQEESKLSGILKGGKLWKSTDSCNQTDFDDTVQKSSESIEQTEDEDNKRSVRFNESKDETQMKEIAVETDSDKLSTLTFKVGNHLLVSSNSSKPNSAVRQLFPSSKFILNKSPSDESNDETKYLLTAESLKLFEETKKSKLLQYYNKDTPTLKSPQENDEDEDEDSLKNNLIKRTIERNTLRRSLLKYPNDIKFRKKQNKVENSLVERIKQLTCDVDENDQQKNEEGNDEKSNNKTKEDGEQFRTNPPGEESQKRFDKITTSTYKKFTDLFSRRDKLEAVHPSVLTTPVPIQHQYSYYKPVYNQTSPPDLGNGSNIITKNLVSRNSVTTEARKQFLSSLAPLTACVSGNSEDVPTNKDCALNVPGERSSVASTSTSTAGTEYSINDIDEVLNNDEVKTPQKPPDVLCGTPAGNNEQDELALFVQQDAGRIERIKKRYNAAQNNSDDDENDDYGFNRRPSVRGIKPRFGSTTEILQQMQSQLQPPPLACSSRAGSHITWPCYTADNTRNRTDPRSVMPMVKDDDGYNYIPCANYDHESNDTRLSYQQQVLYSTNLHQPMRIPGGGDFIYQRQLHHPIHTDSPPRTSPVGSMMIPYQNDNQEYYPRQTAPIYARRSMPANILQMRVTSQPIRFPINPQYIESEPHYSTQSASIIRLGHQQTIRVPYPTSGPVQVHLLATRRSESPQRVGSQYVVARGTQTSMYYQNQPRGGSYYHQTVQQNGPNYNNRTLVYGDNATKPTSLQYNNNYPNRPASPIPSLTSSPTRMKPQLERGVPEGAASTSPGFPQDSLYHLSQSTNIPSPSQDVDSPIVPVQPISSSTTPSSSSVFYSMNV